VAPLVTGIDMPQLPIDALRRRLRNSIEKTSAAQPIVVFGCDHGADIARMQADDVCTFSLLCAGQLPPSFVEYALRDGAAGVVVAACREGGCEFRFGERWTAERLRGQREPHLRASVDAGRVELVFAGLGNEEQLAQAIDRLRSVIPSTNAVVSDLYHA
jgi:coenzyme F420-reducing hydrogenase delta subunit